MFWSLAFGFLLGFVGSMPLAGPISVLVFGRGLCGRYRSGELVALGAGIAESLYAFLAYWGMSQLLDRHPMLVLASRGVAAAILLALGVLFGLRQPSAAPVPEAPEREKSSFLLGFAITILNPTFLATWTAAVAVLHSAGFVRRSAVSAILFAGGVLVGIVGWFWLMLRLMRRYRDRFRQETINRVLQGIGLLLVGMGVWFAVRFAQGLPGVARLFAG
jgi:threonine/homoserine/homoserine lactone efflux protein